MSKSHINIILANAPIILGNKGCLALTYSILYLLDEVCRENDITYDIYIYKSLDKDFDTHTLKIGDRQITYHSWWYTKGKSGKHSIGWYFKELLRQTKVNWQILKSADYILDIGAGDSFADIYGKPRFREIDLIHMLARIFHKPYGLLPQTIGPFANKSIKRAAIKTIRNAKFVMARDRQSKEYVQSLLPSYTAIKEYIDVAFALPYTRFQQDKNAIHVGLNVSALLWHGGYTGKNQFDLKVSYPDIVRAVIGYFLEKEGVLLHLVAHVITDTAEVEDDYRLCQALAKEFNNGKIIVAPKFETPIEAKNYISGLDFFLGARMHATIAAYSSHVPVVPMAYSRKFNGLYKDTLQYNYLVDLKEDSMDSILQTIHNAFEKRDQIKMFIAKQNIPNQRIQEIIVDLRNNIGSNDR